MIISGNQFFGGQAGRVVKDPTIDSGQPAQGDNIFKTIAKSGMESLLVRPAARATEALGRTGVFGETIKSGFEEQAETGQEIDLGFLGKYDIAPVDLSEKGIKQLAGETLETAAWLYTPAKVASSLGAGLKGGIVAGAKFGAKAGAIGGGAFGAGEALQEDAGLGEVAGQAALGAGIGALGGGTLGGMLPIVPLAVQGARAGVKKGIEVGKGLAGAGKRVGEGIVEVPTRIVGRAAEGIQKAGERQKLLQSSAPHVRDALKQGIPETDIALLQAGSKADKLQRAAMMETARKAGQLEKGTVAIDRPVRQVGETIVNGPVKFLMETAKKGTTATQNALTGKTSDVRPIFNQFVVDMEKIGLIPTKSGLVATRGSRVPDGDVKFYQQIFRELMPDKKGQLLYSDKQLHSLRQKWWDVSKSDQTFTPGTVSYARRMRALLAKSIDDTTGGQYLPAQKQTQEALTSLKEFARLMGYKGNLDDITTKDLKSGQTFMRIFGNASDRPLSVLDEIYKTAGKYGYKGDENIINQLHFADMLETIYGQPSRSIGGQIGRATQAGKDPAQITAGSIREMVKWSPYAGTIQLLRRSGFLGRRPQDVLKAFEALVRKEAGMSVQGVAPKTLNQLLQEGKKGVESHLKTIKQDIKGI